MPNGCFPAKNLPTGVQTYKTIFGDSPRYIFVSWGKNPMDYASKDQKANEQFGEEISKLWAKSMAVTRKYYTKVGWIQGDLSYYPSEK